MHGHEVFVCRSRSKIYTPMSDMGATAGIMTSFGIKFLEGEMIKLSRSACFLRVSHLQLLILHKQWRPGSFY